MHLSEVTPSYIREPKAALDIVWWLGGATLFIDQQEGGEYGTRLQGQ